VVSDELAPNGEAQVLSAKDYYPFGMSMPSRATEGGTYRYGFNGKEKDTETDLNDFGARFYAANLGRWLSIDPLAAKFPNWSPYNAMNDNPMFFIDPDGKEVKPANQHAFNIIKYGLSKEESAYLKLNSNGMIDRLSLEQGMKELGSVGGNYQALLKIVQAKEITEIIVSETFEYIDHSGNRQIQDFGDVTYTSEMEAMWEIQKEDYEKSGLSKTDFEKNNPELSKNESISGHLGVTLYAGENKDGGGYGTSTNGNTTIYINSRAIEKTQTANQAHENYGHNYFKILGRRSSHGDIKSRTSNASNNNKELEIQIYDREREAEKNYQQHQN
jgi:RHS repeat-associated protein